ncbi:MAG: hypothetical protein GXP27_14375 [Planctomycetes bacterium]|nr:hypothetical protein [Planctomycetota bacterium]
MADDGHNLDLPLDAQKHEAPAHGTAEHMPATDPRPVDAGEVPEWFIRRRRRRTATDEGASAEVPADVPFSAKEVDSEKLIQPPAPPAAVSCAPAAPPAPPSPPNARHEKSSGVKLDKDWDVPASPEAQCSTRAGATRWTGWLSLLAGLLTRITQGVGRFVTEGVVVSLLFHAILLGIFSLIVLQSVKPSKPFSTLFSEADDEGTDLGDLSEAQVEMPDLSAEGVQLPQLQPLPIPTDPSLRSAIVPDLQRSAEAIAESLLKADGGGGDAGLTPHGGFKMPGSGNVVRKGSFTAWTVPEDPDPGESYLIVIQVRLPRWVRNYSPRDLTGHMRGTDGYTTPIGFYRGRYYGKFNSRAKQLVIRIPGAAKNVRDTIHVESRLLREKQDLEIVF